MRITSNFKTKGTFKRDRSYSKQKKQPEISHRRAVSKPSKFDYSGCEDLTGKIDLSKVMVEELTPAPFKRKEAQEFRKDIVKDIIDELSLLTATVPRKQVKVAPVKLTKNGASICVLLSDWHFGKVIKTRSGKFIYDSAIAINRVEKTLSTAVSKYTELMSKGYHIDEIVFIFAGDIVDNDIVYDTQRFRIDKPVGMQFNDVIRSIVTMAMNVHGNVVKINPDVSLRFECVVGNHGRASSASKIGVCSWDTAVYSAIDLVISNSYLNKSTSVSFALEDYKIINVRGWRGLIRHQAPAQSETPSAKKKFGGWNEIFDYDFCCYGDLHHWGASTYNGRPLLMNGSLCGYDEFAINIAVRDEWTQLIWTATDADPVMYLQKIMED